MAVPSPKFHSHEVPAPPVEVSANCTVTPASGAIGAKLNDASGAMGAKRSKFFTRQAGDLTQGLTIGPMLPPPTFTEPHFPSADAGTPDAGDPNIAPFTGVISWSTDPGPPPDIAEVLLIVPSVGLVWTIILPGSSQQVTLPPLVVDQLHANYVGQQGFLILQTSRSPKFDYQQWTYDTTLSEVN